MNRQIPVATLAIFFLLTNSDGDAQSPNNCDLTIFPGHSIQGAADSVGEGGVVCLQSGVYDLSTTIIRLEESHTGLLLTAADGASPVLFSSKSSPVLVLNRAHGVEFSGLQFEVGRAMSVNRSENVKVVNNQFRRTNSSGLAVIVIAGRGFFGGGADSAESVNGFVFSRNTVTDMSGVVLYDCNGCKVEDNSFVGRSSSIQLVNYSEVVNTVTRGITVSGNSISGARFGATIFAIARDEGGRTDVSSLMHVVSLSQNQISAVLPINVISQGFGDGFYEASATVKNVTLIRNQINCEPGLDDIGIALRTFADFPVDEAVIENTKIIRNTFSNCINNVVETGEVVGTVLPPDVQQLLDEIEAMNP